MAQICNNQRLLYSRGGVLILDGSTVKGDGVTFIVGNINLNGGKLWLITGAATHVQLKVKRLRGEGAILPANQCERNLT